MVPPLLSASRPAHYRSLARLVCLFCLLPVTAHAEEPALLDTWGSVGTGPGEWVEPLRLTVIPYLYQEVDPQLVVVDRASQRVQRFAIDGTLLAEWSPSNTALVDPVAAAWRPEWATPSAEAELMVLDAGAQAVLVFDLDGNLLRETSLPAFDDGDLAFDTIRERIHVLLSDRQVLDTYDVAGVLLERRGTLDTSGSAMGEFDTPRTLALSRRADALVVADTGNDRIQWFGLNQSGVDVFGSPGSGPGQFSEPRGIAFDCRGRVLVADTGNDRVQRIRTDFTGFDGLDEIWFEAPGGALSRPVDLVYPLEDALIVGKDDPAAQKRAVLGGDLFLLDSEQGTLRRLEGVCCASGGLEIPGSATSAGGHLIITPAGTGPTLAEVGATVEVQILDLCDEPIIGFPFQDIWLDDPGTGEIALCQGGSVADANTDAQGRTTISGAIAGGGWTDAGMQVYISGSPLDQPPLDIGIRSPDINADLVVDLTDIAAFAEDLMGQTNAARSDLNFDGVINLSDVAAMGVHSGDECP